jgi:LacI family transcriptional regulator
LPSIKKVAEEAGVSVGTVSHVITGSVNVSESLRRKVQAAIRALNYHPNHVARSLKTSRTRTLGIVVPDLTIPFFPKVIQGAEDAARRRGYSMMAVNSGDDEARQKEILSLFRSQRVEGILLVMAAAPTPLKLISRTIDAGISVVFVDRIPDWVPVDSVCVENLEAAEMGVSHLIAMGARRIAAVTGPQGLKNEQRRLLGYRRALRRAGIPLDRSLIWEGNLRHEDVAALCRDRLANPAARPEALFATNGPTALGALRAMCDLGLKTPDDIAFVTVDEVAGNDLFRPGITTVVQPAYEIGFRAAELLLERIENPAARTQRIAVRLPARLIVRESSGVPPARARTAT